MDLMTYQPLSKSVFFIMLESEGIFSVCITFKKQNFHNTHPYSIFPHVIGILYGTNIITGKMLGKSEKRVLLAFSCLLLVQSSDA